MTELKHLEDKLNTHLAVYAANGKESKRVADALEILIAHSMERDKKVDEMYALFTEGKLATKIIKWSFALAITLGGAYLMAKNILK